MIPSDFELQLAGFGLTTAKILYRMPDHPSLVQEFLWQRHDVAPRFPKLAEFLEFWQRELDGPLHSVFIAHNKLVGPNEWRSASGHFQLH